LTAVVCLLVALNSNATVQLTPSTTAIKVNESFTLNITASALNNIDSASVAFNYDPALLRLDGITLDGGAAFCDLIIKDSIPDDGLVEGIFALAHQPAGNPCPALSGDFVAFQIKMTALALGNASLAITQNAPGFGWTSEDNPGVIVNNTTAQPIQIAVIVDNDNDGIADNLDNCTEVSNPAQQNTDGDIFGNACDADFNNDNFVNSLDLGLFKQMFFTSGDVEADLNGDQIVNSLDLGLFKARFFQAPGPSGIVE